MNSLNCNFIPNDFQFVAVCGRTSADLLDSYNMDRRISLEGNTGKSFGTMLKRIFRGK